MITTKDYYGYNLVVREMTNGWYEVSTMAESMGEEYRQHQLLDHEPTEDDYARFVSVVEKLK